MLPGLWFGLIFDCYSRVDVTALIQPYYPYLFRLWVSPINQILVKLIVFVGNRHSGYRLPNMQKSVALDKIEKKCKPIKTHYWVI